MSRTTPPPLHKRSLHNNACWGASRKTDTPTADHESTRLKKKKEAETAATWPPKGLSTVSHCARRRTSTALRSTPPTKHPEHSKTLRKQEKKENTGWEKCLRRPVQHHHHTNPYRAVRVTWWSTAADTQRGELEASRAAGDVGRHYGGKCPCCFGFFFKMGKHY